MAFFVFLYSVTRARTTVPKEKEQCAAVAEPTQAHCFTSQTGAVPQHHTMPVFSSKKKDDDAGNSGSDEELETFEPVVSWHEQRWELALWCFEILALAAGVGTAAFFCCLMLNFLAVLLLEALRQP